MPTLGTCTNLHVDWWVLASVGVFVCAHVSVCVCMDILLNGIYISLCM